MSSGKRNLRNCLSKVSLIIPAKPAMVIGQNILSFFPKFPREIFILAIKILAITSKM
jgi:hypothetical protein